MTTPKESPLFPWETMSAIIGGTSAIDVPRLQVYHLRDAEAFLEGYGFRWDDRHHATELEDYRREAIAFLQEELLHDEPDLRIPSEVRNQTDVRRLLLWASTRRDELSENTREMQMWSCSILRLMHTLAHCESYFNSQFGEEIRAQITHRFTPHLFDTEAGKRLGEGEDSVPLVHFALKQSKSKHSLLIKLLHKPENVATDIFDRLGVRFVTQDRFDALRVVRYLRVHNVFMFANVKPSRSRNSLIDMAWLRREAEAIGLHEELSPRQRAAHLRKAINEQPYAGPPDSSHNPHSDRRYHAIQFTCRQLIRVRNPYTPEISARIDAMRYSRPDINDACDQILRAMNAPSQIRFFFPFEVQITDATSYEMNRVGDASHLEYKARQRDTVKRRVLGRLLG